MKISNNPVKHEIQYLHSILDIKCRREPKPDNTQKEAWADPSMHTQGAKKVVSDSPGLVDFAIRLVNSVLNLPDGQAKIFRRIKITKVLQDKMF